jgi:transposase
VKEGYAMAKAPANDPLASLTDFRTYAYGNLAVVLPILERLHFVEMIDSLVQPDSQKEVTPGQSALVLALSRLNGPVPLCHMEEWVARHGADKMLGIEAEKFNDDQLGRGLDAVHGVLEDASLDFSTSVISTFGIDLSQLHFDPTLIRFQGEYDGDAQQDDHDGIPAEAVRITYGADRNGVTDEKVLKATLTTSADGAVPVLFALHSGNAADVHTSAANLERLRKLFESTGQPDRVIRVSDKGGHSEKILAEFCEARMAAIAPRSLNKTFKKLLLANLDAFAEIDYRPERQKDDDNFQPYRVWEASGKIRHPETKKKYPVRNIFFFSPGYAQIESGRRETQIRKAEEALAAVQKSLRRKNPPPPKKAEVQQRVRDILHTKNLRRWIRTGVTAAGRRVTLTFERDPDAIDQDAKLDGYGLIQTVALPKKKYPAKRVLPIYKGQWRSERRNSNFKTPMKAAPLYLKNTWRIEALLFIWYVAVVIDAVIEREYRRRVRDEKLNKTTTRTLFFIFQPYTLVEFDVASQTVVRAESLTPEQAAILRVLRLPTPQQQLEKIR